MLGVLECTVKGSGARCCQESLAPSAPEDAQCWHGICLLQFCFSCVKASGFWSQDVHQNISKSHVLNPNLWCRFPPLFDSYGFLTRSQNPSALLSKIRIATVLWSQIAEKRRLCWSFHFFLTDQESKDMMKELEARTIAALYGR